MRIVSLLPAATEWIYAFGAGDSLVGRSHACDYPAEVSKLPVLTQPRPPTGVDSASIDSHVRRRLREGHSLFDVDLALLRELEPDLVVTQAQSDVCAVSMSRMEADLAAWPDHRPNVFALEPHTLRDALDGALHLARAIDAMDVAIPVLGAAEVRLRSLRERLGLHKRSDPSVFPSVIFLQWLDPLMAAGYWMPGVAEMAGGRTLLTGLGERSRSITGEELLAADPDVIVVVPCGYTLEDIRRELDALTGRPGWRELRAVDEERVWLFDGNAYFNRPGPRLYRSIELLAAALYPDRVPSDAAAWEASVL